MNEVGIGVVVGLLCGLLIGILIGTCEQTSTDERQIVAHGAGFFSKQDAKFNWNP